MGSWVPGRLSQLFWCAIQRNSPPLFCFACLTLRTPRPATETRDGPTRTFHPKPPPPPNRNSGTPRKYPESTPKKYPHNTQKKYARFGGIFGVFSWVPGLWPGGVFLFCSVCFVGNVGPSRGSAAGRGVLCLPHRCFVVKHKLGTLELCTGKKKALCRTRDE